MNYASEVVLILSSEAYGKIINGIEEYKDDEEFYTLLKAFVLDAIHKEKEGDHLYHWKDTVWPNKEDMNSSDIDEFVKSLKRYLDKDESISGYDVASIMFTNILKEIDEKQYIYLILNEEENLVYKGKYKNNKFNINVNFGSDYTVRLF